MCTHNIFNTRHNVHITNNLQKKTKYARQYTTTTEITQLPGTSSLSLLSERMFSAKNFLLGRGI